MASDIDGVATLLRGTKKPRREARLDSGRCLFVQPVPVFDFNMRLAKDAAQRSNWDIGFPGDNCRVDHFA